MFNNLFLYKQAEKLQVKYLNNWGRIPVSV